MLINEGGGFEGSVWGYGNDVDGGMVVRIPLLVVLLGLARSRMCFRRAMMLVGWCELGTVDC